MMKQILSLSLEQLWSKREALYADLTSGVGQTLVIMGTGYLGKAIAERLAGLCYDLVCFCDNNPAMQGSTLLGKPVLAVAEAVRRYNRNAAFVIGIFNGNAARQQLVALDCQAVLTAATFCHHLGQSLPPLGGFDHPELIYTHRSEIDLCHDLWADDKSRHEFTNVLQWCLSTNQEALLGHDPVSEIYFPRGLWSQIQTEHYLDCGAFNGDSVGLMLKQTGPTLSYVTAYEPDPANFTALRHTMALLPAEHRDHVRAVNAAVGDKSGQLTFSDSAGMGSAVGTGGNITVECIRLDDEHHTPPPTFIKMDVEGYELSAMAGARNLIRTHLPVLAITSYHKTGHLWEIPLFIKSLNSGYNLYFRRYGEDCWETVCYAVPPHRSTK